MSNSTQRLVQVFLTEDSDLPAIYEVSISSENKRLSCTCPGFRGRSTCKHVKFVRDKISNDDGKTHYVLRLEDDTPDEVIDKIVTMTADEYRQFIVKYGMIEVI